MGMCLISFEREIVEIKIKQGFHIRVQMHLRERKRLAPKLFFRLVAVIGIKMGVPEGMDEIARCQPRDLCHHQGKQRVGSDVERDPQEHIGAALI